MASSLLRRAGAILPGATRGYLSLLGAGANAQHLSTSAQLNSVDKSNLVHYFPPDKFDQHYVDFFSRPNIDGWEIRRGLTELQDHDVIPDPKIVVAVLRAIRRVNDFALALRFLEAIKIKCGSQKNVDTIYKYIIKEVQPVLDELGISTPEELGYDKPELWIPESDKYWEKSWYKEYGTNKLNGYEEFR